MSDYIKRELAIAALESADALGMTFEDADRMIRCLPAADVAPVRHGQWRLYGADKRGRGGIWMCTGCKGLYPYKNRYCPNCGAKMDGGDDK